MAREAKLLGFMLLLAAIFIGAHAAGAHLGPVTTSHAQVSYSQPGGMTGGMTMGPSGGDSPDPASATPLRGGRP